MVQNVKDFEITSTHTLSELLGKEVLRMQRIGGGRNSRVYFLECEGGQNHVAKHYFTPGPGGRDTLKSEFQSLMFLWDRGERAVPQPMLADPKSGLAVFDYVPGTKLASSEFSQHHLDQAVTFLLRLKAYSRESEALGLQDAAEACFSISSILNNLEVRLNRLRTIDERECAYSDLQEFLSKSFKPAFAEITEGYKSSLNTLDLSVDLELALEYRTLSPSDFGFHNAILRPDGRMIFLDFEYFGWDDPAKMVSDFLLHPAMDQPWELNHKFFTDMIAGLASDRLLEDRIRVVCPLFGLKWCLILLNEFVPQELDRRAFATGNDQDSHEVQTRQLLKAKKMLDTAKQYYEDCPF